MVIIQAPIVVRTVDRAMPQSSETVLGKRQDLFDPQGVDPEDVDPEASDSEVSFGTDDQIPPEFPVASEEDKEDERLAELKQWAVTFIEQMKAMRPEIVPGVRVWKLLHYLPSAWLGGNLKDLHGLSQQTAHLDQFVPQLARVVVDQVCQHALPE